MENGFIKPKRQALLTAAGVLAVIAGLVFVYFGFFMLSDANNSASPDLTEAQHNAIKLLSLGGFYLMINGVFNVVAGFYGAVNSGVKDCSHKCMIYGWILLAMSVVNVAVLAVITDIIGNAFNMILLSIPLGISIIYCIGGLLNKKLCTNNEEEM